MRLSRFFYVHLQAFCKRNVLRNYRWNSFLHKYDKNTK